MTLYMAGVFTGLFIAVTAWAIGEVRTVEHWNK